MPNPIIAMFRSEADARAWRAERGGWLYVADAGPVLWFDDSHNASAILAHPIASTVGKGRLVWPWR